MSIIVLFTFFVTQNNQMVIINFFFWQYTISAIILIIMTGFIGVLLGVILIAFSEPRELILTSMIFQLENGCFISHPDTPIIVLTIYK